MRLKWHGYFGLSIIIVAEILLFARQPFVSTWYTPIAWTGYILFADALILRKRGSSLFHDRLAEVPFMAFLSVLCWLVFEVYNLRLANWAYVGVPGEPFQRTLGYGWSFATIFPGIFQTAELLDAYGVFSRTMRRPFKWGPAQLALSFIAGLAFVTIPLALPRTIGAYLFAAVWVGYIFLLEPVNYRLGAPSIFRELEEGRPARMWQLLTAGLLCGLLWEFWNYWAAGKWIYIFPMFQNLKLFEMPVPGFLGFPPFALECFAMYSFCMWALQADRWVILNTHRAAN
ncbi:MAG: hypothetical protein HY023_12550 [Chloroflexi bacterium]|nr:hypothetical protein [Chloroflexota bacterium]